MNSFAELDLPQLKSFNMKAPDFTSTILVDKSPRETFEAINNVRGWWSELVEGGTDKLNDEFSYRHKNIHYSKQKLVELVPEKKVVWLVTDSRLEFISEKDEWTGTKVVFEISPIGDKTQIRVTHEGLTPDSECFEACSNGWNFYFDSLKKLISTGKGKPDERWNAEKANV